MQFNSAAFDTFLGGIGQRVLWRRSYSCACVSPTSGSPDPKHALCHGKGRLWDPAIETVTGIASQKVRNEWIQMGMYESGDAVLSVPQNSPLWSAGPFDRITMLNGTDVFSMPLQHGAPAERLLFHVARIDRCFWLHPTTRQIVEGGLPTVDANGNLTWSAGEPPPGMTYSLTGEKFSEYFMFQDMASDRNEHQGMRLPKRLVLRKWDLFGR